MEHGSNGFNELERIFFNKWISSNLLDQFNPCSIKINTIL